MAGTGNNFNSLRPGRNQYERIMLALAISLFLHVLLYTGYKLNKEIRLLPRLPSWLAVKSPPPQLKKYEEPLEFVTVPNPSTVAPEKAKYYSNKNSIATDSSANRNADKPQLNGRQTDVPETQDESRFQRSESPIGASQQEANTKAQSPTEPKPSLSAGDLTLGKPDNTEQQPPRPRTLKDAYAQRASHIPSMTMKEDGGARQRGEIPAFDVKLTGFGNYDARFFGTIRDNWLDDLDSHKFSQDRIGKVVVTFVLNSDGRISQFQFVQNDVGELLGYVCQKAVLDGAPYEPWTEEMRTSLGESTQITIVFDYLPP
jgi:hypothetical protein